jgi:predicted nucleic acid-binding protein
LNQEGCNEVKAIVADSELVAPTCLSFEIGNAISKLIRRNLISAFDGVAIFHEFAKIPTRLIEPDIPNSIVIADETKSYAYDSYYINLAKQYSFPLFTLDQNMKENAIMQGVTCL